MTNQDIITATQQFVMNTYARFPVAIEKGKGVYCWDVEGKKYLDFISGIGVNILGYNHPRVTYALAKQAKDLIHMSNLVHIPTQTELAKKLVDLSFADKVFFCNSGAEANEGAVKLARRWGGQQNPARYEILTADRSFHGRTLGMIAASGQERLRAGFGPVAPGFRTIPFGDSEAARRAVGPETCAMMIEPIQGEGGVTVPSRDYLKDLRDLTQEKKLLLILDEVQTGMGRTGKLFAYEHFGIEPDIMTLAKGLGGGIPIGAVLARDHVAAVLKPGEHASTFGGNPLATAVALQVLTALEEEHLLTNATEMGHYLAQALKVLGERSGKISGVRHLGLMVGCNVSVSARDLVAQCLNGGLLLNAIGDRILRFLPPLIIKKNELDEGMVILEKNLVQLS